MDPLSFIAATQQGVQRCTCSTLQGTKPETHFYPGLEGIKGCVGQWHVANSQFQGRCHGRGEIILQALDQWDRESQNALQAGAEQLQFKRFEPRENLQK